MQKQSHRMLNSNDWGRFNQALESRLVEIEIPDCVNCRDVHCNHSNHIQDLDDYSDNILAAIDSSTLEIAATKRQNNKKAKIIPSWSDVGKPFAVSANF